MREKIDDPAWREIYSRSILNRDRRSKVPLLYADNRTCVFEYRILQRDEQIYAADGRKSKHTMAIILHRTQYLEMQGGIDEEIREIR
jgi:hypothetical protein